MDPPPLHILPHSLLFVFPTYVYTLQAPTYVQAPHPLRSFNSYMRVHACFLYMVVPDICIRVWLFLLFCFRAWLFFVLLSYVFISSLSLHAISLAYSPLTRYSVLNEFSVRTVVYSGLCHSRPKANAPGSNSAIFPS